MTDTHLSPDSLPLSFASCCIELMVCHLELFVGAQVLEDIHRQVVLHCTWDCERYAVCLALWAGGPCVPDGGHIALVAQLEHSHTDGAFEFDHCLQVAETEGAIEA